jgi:tetratricopeptide (TPR) repeat protein
MIPNSEQLLAVSQMERGDLGEIPFPVLLHALAVHRRSVLLEIERRQLKKSIVLENGIPVDCQSNLLQDTLGKFMVSRGDLTEEQNQKTLAKSATTGQSFSDLLVIEGLVNAHELYKILQLNLAKKLLDGFTWRSGTFHVSTSLPEVDSPLKVRAPQLVLTGISKFAPESEIPAAMAPFAGKKFFFNPKPPFPLKELRLSPEHKEILGLVSLGKTIEELEAETKLARNKVLRGLYALAVIGVALPEDWLQSARPPEAAPDMDFSAPAEAKGVGETAPPPPPPSGLSADDVAQVRNDVMEIYLRYRKLDAFDLLGLSPDADRETVEQSYLDYCEKYAPWKFRGPELKNLEEKARDLFVAGGHAFGELVNPETRNSLIARRDSRFQNRLSTEEARNAFAIKSNLLDSETQFAKGMALMEQSKFQEALELLQFAHDCEPQNGVYRAELAFCRYRKDPDIERDNVLQELEETVRIDPECGVALYYKGLVLGEGGEYGECEPYLQRAIKLMAPDRRPIEALKRFKAAEKEKPKKRLFF